MSCGSVNPGWEPVRTAFDRVLHHDRAGASVAVVRRGQLVVDLWGGADPVSGQRWDEQSVTLGFSTAKGIVALLCAQEIQAGRLHPDQPVADSWPEFGAAGKAEITVGQVLTHTAGMVTVPARRPEELLDPAALTARLAEQPPDYRPGSARLYHVLSYGTILAEVLRRVTGRDIGQLVAERIAGPLGVSAWFGMPTEAERRYLPAVLEPVQPIGATPAFADVPPMQRLLCGVRHQAQAQVVPLFVRRDGTAGSELVNSTAFRSAQIPAGGLVCDARALALVYGACLSPISQVGSGSVRLLDEASVAQVATDHLRGIAEPRCEGTAVPTDRWGLGFEISHRACPMLGPGSFGHAGMGGRLGFAHRGSAIGFGFVAQRMRFPTDGVDPRWRVLLRAVRDCAHRERLRARIG
ncbi:serine hydrolase domain-containing protein [Micromonospora sp. NPDC057141]|uniref:serine hydrolase domain-containing protein n=1 Tax=Micromonospora sp. NPDC057141 TaxID=3346033 RepID=UPI00363E5A36